MATASSLPPFPRSWLVRIRPFRRYIWTSLVLCMAYGLAFAMHWDDRALLWLRESWQSKAERHASVWLPDYQVDIDAKILPGIEKDEASDLAYNPVSKTLFAVMGRNPFLVELSLEGDVLRKIPLEGWANPEGVAVLEDDLIAITDERKHLLTISKVTADTTRLDIADATQYDLGRSDNQNKGFEGVVWDQARHQLLLGEERPAAIFTWRADGSEILKGEKRNVSSDALDVRNLSSLSIDPRTDHTLVLSADSHLLLELDRNGRQVSFMTLLGGMNGLKSTIPRAEGVALDEDGTIYMVSEPNLFYSFRKH